MPDLLDLTARQVRANQAGQGVTVHRLRDARTGKTGRVYTTLCGRTLYRAGGAVLTTVDVGCAECRAVDKLGSRTEGGGRRG